MSPRLRGELHAFSDAETASIHAVRPARSSDPSQVDKIPGVQEVMRFGMVAIIVWAMVSAGLRRHHLSGTVVMVLCGLVSGIFLIGDLEEHLDTDLAEHIVELVLALLLFLDATEVRGGFLAGERSIVARLLAGALPLSILTAACTAAVMFPSTPVSVALALACVAMPVDFAPAPDLIRDRRLPRRIRHGLVVESGYNDGIFSPVFAAALLLAAGSDHEEDAAASLAHAVPAIGYAVLVGVGAGAVVGLLARITVARGWTTSHGLRPVMLLLPLAVYGFTVLVDGNGFVAAFLAGLVYRRARVAGSAEHGDVPRDELLLVDEVGNLMSLFMWFVVGAVATLLFQTPVDWRAAVFALLALTVLRVVPVLLSFPGSSIPARERLTLGLLGPRGTSTIVFGLLAFNALDDDSASLVLQVTVLTVLGSSVLHGVLATRVLPAPAATPPAHR